MSVLVVDGITYHPPDAWHSRRPMVSIYDGNPTDGAWHYRQARPYCEWCWMRKGFPIHLDWLHRQGVKGDGRG